jgi:hypothetical protein
MMIYVSRSLFTLITIICLLTPIIDLLYYIYYVHPQPFHPPIKPRGLYRFLGTAAYLVAYILSLLRLPFATIPYCMKLLIVLVLKTQFQPLWNSYPGQLLRTGGDFINFLLTICLTEIILDSSKAGWIELWLPLIIGAEAIRLVSEKGQMLVSALWQFMPHRFLAQRIILPSLPSLGAGWLAELSTRYCGYYSLNDEERITSMLHALKTVALPNPEAAKKLEYIHSVRIVPTSIGLRAGIVRDVARGEIFIHARWTNDPWLLVGQMMRRGPWIFDPRFLRRPFYYRTEANRLTTLFVLQHLDYSLPYAWYQFGHEIKVARYDLFYRICRWLGLNIEETVREDGTFRFDHLMNWLGLKLSNESNQRPLWSDEEVILDIEASSAEIPSAMEIAARYTYPLNYVQEVLLPEIVNRKDKSNRMSITFTTHSKTLQTLEATAAGASQCG